MLHWTINKPNFFVFKNTITCDEVGGEFQTALRHIHLSSKLKLGYALSSLNEVSGSSGDVSYVQLYDEQSSRISFPISKANYIRGVLSLSFGVETYYVRYKRIYALRSSLEDQNNYFMSTAFSIPLVF